METTFVSDNALIFFNSTATAAAITGTAIKNALNEDYETNTKGNKTALQYYKQLYENNTQTYDSSWRHYCPQKNVKLK